MLPKGFAASSSTGWAAEGSHRRTGVLPSLGGVRGLLQASTFPSGKASMWMVTIGRLTGADHAPPVVEGPVGIGVGVGVALAGVGVLPLSPSPPPPPQEASVPASSRTRTHIM